MFPGKVRRVLILIFVVRAVVGISLLTIAQTPTKPLVRFTATTDNVASAGETVRIDLFAWSTEADRDEFVKSWVSPSRPAPAVGEDPAPAGRGGRGNRGAEAPAPAVNAVRTAADAGARGDAGPDGQASAGGRGARSGRGGRGGRGAGGGGDEIPAAPAAPMTPAASLAASLKKAPGVGMLWTSETVGYSLRYAYRLTQPDGSERIILATDRRLGAWNNFWKPVGTSTAIDYPFSVIELRLSATGLGEGKASLITSITVDNSAKSIALDNYSSSPVVLKTVNRQAVK